MILSIFIDINNFRTLPEQAALYRLTGFIQKIIDRNKFLNPEFYFRIYSTVKPPIFYIPITIKIG